MPAYKDEEKGTWFCEFRYKDNRGNTRKTKKRGFKTKKEALEYERFFLTTANEKAENITFEVLSKKYLDDVKTRIKITTYARKEKLFKLKLIPYFGNMKIEEITPLKIRNWQNMELKNNYKKSYFLTIQKELSAIFNYAQKFYNLKINPIRQAGAVTNSPYLKDKDNIQVWNIDDFNEFIQHIKSIELYTIFHLLFYTGASIGEILALNIKSFDFKNNTMKITKTYSKVNGVGYLTSPKTKGSIRTIKIPLFLTHIVENYLEKLYDKNIDRIFQTGRTNIHETKNKIIRKYNLKNIRLHDFRHSHASILLNEGVNIVAVSKRLGHESIKMTLDTYSHLMDNGEEKLIDVLNKIIDKK